MISPADILKARILIVDDLEANVLLLEQMLRNGGYTAVTSTMQPDQVCELHLLHHYDLIILDLLMPKMDGFEVMENLKTIETGGYLPVLVITAQPEHKLRALKAGARDFVSKPFDLAEVLLRVHNLLEVRLLHLETLELCRQVGAEKKVSEHLLLELVRRAPDWIRSSGPEGDPQAAVASRSCGSAEVAVLFMDLAAFTAFSEGADARALMGILATISQAFSQPDGSSRDRSLSHAYLATVGLPDAVANHTIAAAERALELLEAVDRFNEHNPYKLKVTLSVAAGPGAMPADWEAEHEAI